MGRASNIQTKVSFRPLAARDLPLLHECINRPHIAQWWGGGGPTETFEATSQKYAPRIAETSPIKPYIANVSGQPVGFIQSYVAMACGDGWWPNENDPGVVGTDQFLFDETDLGKGLGTAIVSAFVARLFGDPAVTRVQTDPDPSNARAVRCYEKVGFRPLRLVKTPNGEALLMVIDREGYVARRAV
jgi:RimJ/RimL family protein N-acetyltransferase